MTDAEYNDRIMMLIEWIDLQASLDDSIDSVTLITQLSRSYLD